jgi:predicted amidohydrolase YtcJ
MMRADLQNANTCCFVNGIVRTQNSRLPLANAVVTKGGMIAFVGSTSDAISVAGPSAEVRDLGGRLMLPGFIDNHTHFVWGGAHLLGIDLRGCRSIADFRRTIGEYVARHRGRWVTGGDWDQEAWENRKLPAREAVDVVSPDTPLFVQRFDGHMALANSVALKMAGITRDTPDPGGGIIERDPGTGEPTGILRDSAMELVTGIIPKQSPAETERAVQKAQAEALSNGITSIHDITLPEHLEVYRTMEREGMLTCRIYTRLPISGYEELVRQGVTAGHGSDLLKTGSLKAFSDGSLGSGTALFFDPYLDDPSNEGLAMEIVTNGDLRRWALDADRNGLQLSIHAIGDKANHLVLSLFEEIVRANPPWDRRFRIEHAQHVRAEDIPLFAKLGVIVSAQPYHAVDDGVWAERKIGPERLKTTYAFRSFIDAGVTVCFGSDWTVAPLNALAGIHAAVTRSTLDGKNAGGWIPEQKLTVGQAVRCYTVNNATAAFEERVKGTIEVGKLADLVVLSEDIYSIDPSRINTVRVDMTVFGGQVRYQR